MIEPGDSANSAVSRRPVQIGLRSVRRAFGDKQVIQDLTLDILQGEFLTLFGPNGCGKTTLLNMIAGIETVDSGTVSFQSGAKPKIGYIFQDYRGNLMPWLTVAENIALPLRVRGVPRRERMGQVESLHARFGFDIDLGAFTHTLSGGQAQLTSILRALIIDPGILIMDEPFSALDYQTSLNLYDAVLRVWEQAKVTVLMVSHNIDEALYLGERTAFLSRRPAHIAEVLENDLPRPKGLEQMGSARFAARKRNALEIFRQETAIKPGARR
jgi:NitT/TauT family transport system ATP-binding protein